jgi:L-serine dehydratase
MGPWRAALDFVKMLKRHNFLQELSDITIYLYGSLAKTGKGHGTDMAVILGLLGEKPDSINPGDISDRILQVRNEKRITIGKCIELPFDPEKQIIFNKEVFLTFHPNGISIEARLSNGRTIQSTYYSLGGGFIVKGEYPVHSGKKTGFPYPINTSADVMKWTASTGLPVSGIVFENELSIQSAERVKDRINRIWKVMQACVYRGCHTEGLLPGGLKVKRRASEINSKLLPDDRSKKPGEWIQMIKSGSYEFNEILKWVSCFALAVNEENASFGRVVTAPTNGAAGVIPAVLLYMVCFLKKDSLDEIYKFLLVAGEIGSIFKKGSTISAAMGGCQAEIGVSSAMAAAALTECLGGDPGKVLMAAEIAMEHHLGLTCDPVGGLVQVPCIERNSMGAIKAITASMLAMESDPRYAKVSLDHVIKTMWDTAQDMNLKYKETSDGGLAINIPVNITEC